MTEIHENNWSALENIREKDWDLEEDIDDPFFSPENLRYLKELYEKIKNGTAELEEHDLIEI